MTTLGGWPNNVELVDGVALSHMPPDAVVVEDDQFEGPVTVRLCEAGVTLALAAVKVSVLGDTVMEGGPPAATNRMRLLLWSAI